jgi:hypothetical protein
MLLGPASPKSMSAIPESLVLIMHVTAPELLDCKCIILAGSATDK